jgi:hypothetical protein
MTFNENWYLGVFWSEELVGAQNSDMGVVWELLCLHPSTIKPSYYYYITPTVVRWCIVIPRFFFTLITSPRLLSGDVLLFYVVFFNLLAFWPFPWQRQPFWKNKPYTAQLDMTYDIPTKFHKVWSRHLREIERTKMCGRIRIIRIVKKKRRIAIHHPTTVGVM